MSDLDDLQLADGDRLFLTATEDQDGHVGEIEVSVLRASQPTVIDIAAVMQEKRLRAFREYGQDWNDHEFVLCRNDLPFRMRVERTGTSNKCHAEVLIPNEGDLRFLRCPSCGQPVDAIYGRETTEGLG